MFINAKPRFVSNGFETFVPNQRVEALHQRLVEMTNNDVNAWSIFRPVVPSTDAWDHHFDDYSTNENFRVQNLYGGHFHDVATTAQNQQVELPKTISYNTTPQIQNQPQRRPVVSQQAYQQPVSDMNCFEKPSPMLGNDYSQWSLGRGRGSFAEFSSIRNVLKDFTYQPSADVNTTYSTSGTSNSTFNDELSMLGSSSNLGRTSPSTVYSNYLPSRKSVDPYGVGNLDIHNSNNIGVNSTWWPDEMSMRTKKIQTNHSYELRSGYDGLPRYQGVVQQPQYTDPWTSSGEGNWTARSISPNTISSKVLTLNVPPAPMSSSGSSQGSMMAMSDANTVVATGEDTTEFAGTETLAVLEPEQPVCCSRQILANSVPNSPRVVPVLPSNDFSSKSNRKRLTKIPKPEGQSRRKSSPLYEPIRAKPQQAKKVETKPVEPNAPTWAEFPTSSPTAQAAHHRDAKDDFLVRSKLAGMSYKEIRRAGKFTEAESTLRGRFRTLTKHKTARVRKPEWSDNDIRLLKKAVRRLAQGSDLSKGKVPWKQVAEYIANNGGSYHFGNATCRKRWDELQESSK